MQGNSSRSNPDVVIIGGGLAGLLSATMLSRSGKRVLVLEKKSYPHHKVCGEYVSNEVLPFLQSLGFDPFKYGATRITKLRVSTPAGENFHPSLGLGAFGLSRYTLDYELYKMALQTGAEIITKTKVTEVSFADNKFTVSTDTGEVYTTALVIGSYGKRDTLDKQLGRNFIKEHTGYLGVKYHIKTDYPTDEIGLDNFEGGYCGISMVEGNTYNVCYLHHRTRQAKYKTIPDIEANILFKNPVLRNIFSNSEFLFAKPEVINDFSFDRKRLVEDHILMCGDSAGLITPLCGNGMSMAIHAAKILSELILQTGVLDSGSISLQKRSQLEQAYAKEWQQHFSQRLFWGRSIQGMFGNSTLTALGIKSIHAIPPLERWLIARTHGEVIGLNDR